jgi:hypothetical protein
MDDEFPSQRQVLERFAAKIYKHEHPYEVEWCDLSPYSWTKEQYMNEANRTVKRLGYLTPFEFGILVEGY